MRTISIYNGDSDVMVENRFCGNSKSTFSIIFFSANFDLKILKKILKIIKNCRLSEKTNFKKSASSLLLVPFSESSTLHPK